MLSGGADSGSTAMWEQQRQLVQEKQQESDRVKREAHERDTKLAQRRRAEQERRDAADQKEAEELQAAFGRPDPLAQRRQEEQRRRDAADQQEAEELQAAFSGFSDSPLGDAGLRPPDTIARRPSPLSPSRARVRSEVTWGETQVGRPPTTHSL